MCQFCSECDISDLISPLIGEGLVKRFYTLNSKGKYTLLDLSSTQRVADLRFLLSTRKITKCILSFGVECK